MQFHFIQLWNYLDKDNINCDMKLFIIVFNNLIKILLTSQFVAGSRTLLAAGSKDGSIRIWVIREKDSTDSPKGELRIKPYDLEDHEALLETVLSGHTGLVSSVRWCTCPLRLVSASKTEDRSVIVWQPQEEAVWVEHSRLGEVGGNREGFFSALLTADGDCLLGHSYFGGLHQWRHLSTGWSAEAASSGHLGAVVDLSWSAPSGRYLLTCSVGPNHSSACPCSSVR